MPNDALPEWEQVLAAATHLPQILPGAVLVGGSASALYAAHRLSTDADHVLTDLRQRFEEVLAEAGLCSFAVHQAIMQKERGAA